MMLPRRILYIPILIVATSLVPHVIIRRLLQSSNHSSDMNEKNLTHSARSKIDEVSKMSANQVNLELGFFGQMGNHLHIIATGQAIKLFAREMDPALEIKLLHNSLVDTQRLATTRNDITSCFSNLKNVDFYELNKFSKADIHEKYGNKEIIDFNPVVDNEEMISDLLKKKINHIKSAASSERNLHLYTHKFVPPFLVNHYYDDLKQILNFDEKECCNEVPDPDETVVHIRSFGSELKQGLVKNGYNELTSYQMANEMLGHLRVGDKVALVAPSMEASLPYKTSLEAKGVKVRCVSQSRAQDFCFLMKATTEVVAHHYSTYAFWAAILSTSLKKMSFYRVKNPGYEHKMHHFYNWTHPRLKNLFNYTEIEYSEM